MHLHVEYLQRVIAWTKEEAKAINRQIDSLAEDAYEKHREVREIMHAIMIRQITILARVVATLMRRLTMRDVETVITEVLN